MTREFVPIDPDTEMLPAQIDRHLKRLYNELAFAIGDLRKARGEEVNAKKAYTEARNRLLLSGECPRVGRGSNDVTVDEREAWINNRLDGEVWVLEGAKVVRESAEDYLNNTLRGQVSCIQSIGATARQMYDLSGRAL